MSRLRSGEALIAVLLILLGLVFLAANLGVLVPDWSLFWPVLVILFGVWLVWRAWQPTPVSMVPMSWGIGDYRPDLGGQVVHQADFSHGFGDVDLDLTRAQIPDGENVVHVSHGLGDVTVILPRDIAVRAKGSAGLGNVFVLGERAEGFGPSVRFESDDYSSAARKLELEASVGLGNVKILRAG